MVISQFFTGYYSSIEITQKGIGIYHFLTGYFFPIFELIQIRIQISNSNSNGWYLNLREFNLGRVTYF